MFANSRTSASNFKKNSRSLEQFFLTVGQKNFGNKIPFHTSKFQILPFDWSGGSPFKIGLNFFEERSKTAISLLSVVLWEISCDMFDIITIQIRFNKGLDLIEA